MPFQSSGPGPAGPHPAQLLLNQAVQLRRQGQFEAAAQACMQVIGLLPQQAAGYQELMSLLLQIDDLDNAELVQRNIPPALYRQSPPLRYFHAHLLARRDRVAEAAALFESLVGAPGLAVADLYTNIGSCHYRQDHFAAAEAWYDKAATAGQRDAMLYKNRAGILGSKGDVEGAARLYAEGTALFPADSELLYEYANFLLKNEQYADGFRLYKHRWQKLPGGAAPALPIPQWDGVAPMRSLLVLGEQGVGDLVVYSALLPALMARVEKVTLAFDPRLAPLLGRSFPGLAFVDPARQPSDADLRRDYDAWIAAGDLGGVVPEGIGWSGGYLVPDPTRVAALRARYQARFPGRKLVGISWKSQRALLGARKSAGLAAWQPVLQRPGLQFISLQYGDVDADLAEARATLGVDIFRDPDIDAFNDLDGLAAQAHACDLVITTSNSSAHLAAATATPTWVLLPVGASLCWYWGYREEGCRWYPRVRLFRAAEPDTWGPVLARVATALEELP